jgi:fucose permease
MSAATTDSSQAVAARYAVSAVFMVFGVLVGSWLPHIPDVKRHLDCDDAALGQALICSGVGAIVSMQASGWLMHRFGSRRMALLGGLAACLLVPSLLLQTSLLWFSLNLFVLGLGYGVLDVGMNSHAVQVQALFSRSILSSVHGCFSLGGIVGGMIAAGTEAVRIDPFRHLVATSLGLIVVLMASRPFLLPADTDQAEEGPKFVLPRGRLLGIGLMCACAFILEGGMLDWSALYVRESLKAAPAFGGIVTGVCSGSMAIGRFTGDAMILRFGNRNVAFWGSVLTGLGVILSVLAPSLALSLVGFTICGFGLANIVPILFNESGRAEGVSTGVAMAAITTCGYGGFLLGPPIIGLLSNQLTLGVAIGSMVVLAFLMTIGAWRLIKVAR